MLEAGPSRIVIEGGTHNNAAPPFDFLARTFVPLLERMGPKVQLQFERYGFYPAGGGRFCAEIQPVKALKCLHIGERGEIILRRSTRAMHVGIWFLAQQLASTWPINCCFRSRWLEQAPSPRRRLTCMRARI